MSEYKDRVDNILKQYIPEEEKRVIYRWAKEVAQQIVFEIFDQFKEG